MGETTQPRAGRTRGDGAKTVYEQLRREILTLKLDPGTPLDETVLSKRFEMSRSPIREALVRLSADGLATTISNRTTLVAPIDIAAFPRYVEALDFLQRIHMRLAAENRTEADLEIIKARKKDFDRASRAGDFLAVSATNRDFHMSIADAGKNSYLAKSYRDLLDQGRRFVHLNFDHQLSRALHLGQGEDHRMMVEAIELQDAEKAEELGHIHTRSFHDRFISTLQAKYVSDFALK